MDKTQFDKEGRSVMDAILMIGVFIVLVILSVITVISLLMILITKISF